MVAFEAVMAQKREKGKFKENKDEEAGCVKSGIMNLVNYPPQCSWRIDSVFFCQFTNDTGRNHRSLPVKHRNITVWALKKKIVDFH